jgi:copper(I)-binding protein
MVHFTSRRDVLAGLALLGAPGLARAVTVGSLTIEGPWTRPTAAGQNAAGYLMITNAGQADALTRVECRLARRVTLHESRMTNGVMSMRAVTEIPVPARGHVMLSPGGLHIMLEQISRPFAPHGVVPGVLVFRRAGRVPVAFAVQTAAPGSGAMPGMHH